MAPLAVILAGHGRYADPWHPFESTSERLEQLLQAEGFDVEIQRDVDAGMAALADSRPDLLVMNFGAPRA